MNFPFGERGYEIVTGPGRIAQETFRNFAAEQGKTADITSPIHGKLLITLKEKRRREEETQDDEYIEQTLIDPSVYDIFLKQLFLSDDRFAPYEHDGHTRWTAHVIEENGKPVIEAFYL